MGLPGVAAGGGGWDLGVCGLGMRWPTQADGAMGCVGGHVTQAAQERLVLFLKNTQPLRLTK